MTVSLGPDSLPDGVEILRPVDGRQASVLTREALAFVADLQRRFGPLRLQSRLPRPSAGCAACSRGRESNLWQRQSRRQQKSGTRTKK